MPNFTTVDEIFTMALATTNNVPTGTIVTADDIFLEGGPDFWFGGVSNAPWSRSLSGVLKVWIWV